MNMRRTRVEGYEPSRMLRLGRANGKLVPTRLPPRVVLEDTHVDSHITLNASTAGGYVFPLTRHQFLP
jgi:hypothetical protein